MKRKNAKLSNLYVYILVLVAVIMLGGSSSYASNQISLYVDGNPLYMEVPPAVVGGRTMVPLRVVSEAVGCTVDWFGEDKRIVVYSPAGGDPLLVMTINDRNVTVNNYNGETGVVTGEVVTIEAAPIIVGGRTMVPLRFIAETIGYAVEWDDATKTIYLFSGAYEDGRGDYIPEEATESDPGDSRFPQGIVYTEEYTMPGDSGDGLTAMDAAMTLTLNKLNQVYDEFNDVDPIYVTLIGLQFVQGEECYVFQVKKAQYTSTLYAVGYTGNIYEDFIFE